MIRGENRRKRGGVLHRLRLGWTCPNHKVIMHHGAKFFCIVRCQIVENGMLNWPGRNKSGDGKEHSIA